MKKQPVPTKSGKPKPLTRTQRKAIQAQQEIYAHPEHGSRDLAFSPRDLVQATLPQRSPRGNPSFWYRRNGNYTLTIKPGTRTNPKTGEVESVGYPFGNIPRLLIFWMTREALRTGERQLEMGDTLNSFLREIGLNPATGGGKRGDSKRLRAQTERLLRAIISFEYTDGERLSWLDMQVAPKGGLWWDPRQPDQINIFSCWVELTVY